MASNPDSAGCPISWLTPSAPREALLCWLLLPVDAPRAKPLNAAAKSEGRAVLPLSMLLVCPRGDKKELDVPSSIPAAWGMGCMRAHALWSFTV